MRTSEINLKSRTLNNANTKRIIIIISCVCLLVISGQVFAGEINSAVGKVTGVISTTDIVYLRTTITYNPHSCSNSKTYAVPRMLPNAKEIISIAISALLSGKSVNLLVGPCAGWAAAIDGIEIITDDVPFFPKP